MLTNALIMCFRGHDGRRNQIVTRKLFAFEVLPRQGCGKGKSESKNHILPDSPHPCTEFNQCDLRLVALLPFAKLLYYYIDVQRFHFLALVKHHILLASLLPLQSAFAIVITEDCNNVYSLLGATSSDCRFRAISRRLLTMNG